MDVVLIFNGLGNQMSQYAFYMEKKYQNKHTTYLVLNQNKSNFPLNQLFNVPFRCNKILLLLYKLLAYKRLSFTTPILNMFGLRLVRESLTYDFDPENLKHKKGICFYKGGWHSELNFKDVKDNVKKLYRFPTITDTKFVDIKSMIIESNSVSMHIRRGDYLKVSNIWNFSGISTNQYYMKAMEYIEKTVQSPSFYIFTDDIEYCKQTYNEEKFHIVNINRGKDSWRDLYLITLCKNNICANSSFSWWGAWLNQNPDKVVLHTRKFLNNHETNDLYPKDWIVIE